MTSSGKPTGRAGAGKATSGKATSRRQAGAKQPAGQTQQPKRTDTPPPAAAGAAGKSQRAAARPPVVLYTAIYGAYDGVKPLPERLDVPAILYTDSDATAERAAELGWEPRIVPEPRPKADRAAHPEQAAMMRHKYWKTHPLEAVDADVSLWVDGSFTITVDDYVERCLAALGDDDAVFVKHPWRDDIYEEAAFSAALPRYPAAALAEQSAYYLSIGHPAHWGLIATGANVRRHTPLVAELGEHWWWECVHRTWQDQVSLPVLLRIMAEERDPALRWNLNMPWHQWWVIAPHEG